MILMKLKKFILKNYIKLKTSKFICDNNDEDWTKVIIEDLEKCKVLNINNINKLIYKFRLKNLGYAKIWTGFTFFCILIPKPLSVLYVLDCSLNIWY